MKQVDRMISNYSKRCVNFSQSQTCDGQYYWGVSGNSSFYLVEQAGVPGVTRCNFIQWQSIPKHEMQRWYVLDCRKPGYSQFTTESTEPVMIFNVKLE